MIYLLPIFVLCFLICRYDILEKKNYRNICFYLILIWLICISAFQYCVGADTPRYMYDYDKFRLESFDWKYIFTSDIRAQPGWNLLMYLCHFISDDYLAFKIIQAIFLNVTILCFFKSNSKYLFTCILLYCLYLYLDYNFNLMRQSFAVAIFLIGYKKFIKKRWFAFCLYVILAISFHISAIILLLLPLLNLIRMNKCSILFFIAVLVFVLSYIYIYGTNIMGIFLQFFPEEIEYLGDMYINSLKLGVAQGSGPVFFLKIVIKLSLLIYILFYNYKNNLIHNRISYSSYLMYLLLYVITSFLPIMFRFNGYFTVIMICFAANFLMDFPRKKMKNMKKLSMAVLFAIFICILTPIKSYFAYDKLVGASRWVQYYPYYTVFDKKLDHTRNIIFGNHY